MQRIIAALLFTLLLTGPALAGNNMVKVNALRLDLQDKSILKQEVRTPINQSAADSLNLELAEPSAGSSNLGDQLKLKPEFSYARQNDDYNPHNDEYNTQIKLKLNLDF